MLKPLNVSALSGVVTVRNPCFAAASRLMVSMLFACSIQQGSTRNERVLLECSLVSLQAIQQAVGVDSSQYKAATKITVKLVQIVQQLLSDAYDSRYASQPQLALQLACRLACRLACACVQTGGTRAYLCAL